MFCKKIAFVWVIGISIGRNLIIKLGDGKLFLPKPDVLKSQLSLKSLFYYLMMYTNFAQLFY